MKKLLVVCIFVSTFVSSAFGLDQKFGKKFGGSFDEFCKVSGWEKGLHTKNDIGYDFYKKLKVANPVTAEFANGKLKENGWIVVDARDKGARKASGKVSGALLVTADYHNNKKNEFSKNTLLKKFSKKKFKKHLKKRGLASVGELADLNNMNYVLFCNGFKCHRSTWAACQLRKHGVPFEKVNIALGGFSALKDFGAKIK